MFPFRRPEALLTVSPITIQGQIAVAGWHPQGKGGHAVPRNDDMCWFIELRAGQGLAQSATFASMGLTPAKAEGGAGTELVGQLTFFEATVLIGRSAAKGHGHGAAHGTGQTD